MFRILFATDGSAAAAEAGRFLQAMPLPEGAEIEILCVVSEPVPLVGAYAEGPWMNQEPLYEIAQTERDLAQSLLERTAAQLSRPGVETRIAIRDGAVAREIMAAADDFHADLVVVGSRGLTGLDRLLLGSVAQSVARHSRRPVLVARTPRHGLKSCVLATDGSDHAQHAAAFAARVPLPDGMRTTCVHAFKPYDPFPGLFPTDREEFEAAVAEVREKQRDTAARIVTRAAEPLTQAGRPVVTEVREGDPATQILSLAGEVDAALIIAGARGASLIEGLLVGSVADHLVKEAECSVLLVR